MQFAVAVIFGLTYLGLAYGRVPGTGLDRVGITLVGALAILLVGALDLRGAIDAIDVPTIVVLGAMMVLSARYQTSGLYGVIGQRLAAVRSDGWLITAVVTVAAVLSALLTNDVVCLALVPVLARALIASGRNPVVYLLAFACASNIGSAATPVGNPQNILIAQWMDLDFLRFFAAMVVPTVVSLAFVVVFALRGASERLARDIEPAEAPVLDRPAAYGAIALTIAAMVVFVSPIDDWLGAAVIAGLVLVGRTPTSVVLGRVDWGLLLLFAGLFIVMGAFEAVGLGAATGDAVARAGLDLEQPLWVAALVSLLGLVVSNVPAVMALRPLVAPSEAMGWWIALFATFAGNAVLVGSIANLIVAEQAGRLGVVISFRRHLAFGLPVTLFSLIVAGLWLAWYA
jgi:Na+/H+ antiporter NhaD/arsenite permease-like protein